MRAPATEEQVLHLQRSFSIDGNPSCTMSMPIILATVALPEVITSAYEYSAIRCMFVRTTSTGVIAAGSARTIASALYYGSDWVFVCACEMD